jgi:hypothetical protein
MLLCQHIYYQYVVNFSGSTSYGKAVAWYNYGEAVA